MRIEETLVKLNIWFFFIKDDELLEKYNEIWEKVKNSIKKEFDSKPVYNEKYLIAKIKSYNGKINTNFHNNKIPREGSQFICLPVILIDSVFRTGKNCYPQLFLEECKFVAKEKKILKYIIDNIGISSDSDSDEENSNEENSDKETFDKENSDEENSDEKTKIFFFYAWKWQITIIKKARKSSKKKHIKGTKTFQKNKKT